MVPGIVDFFCPLGLSKGVGLQMGFENDKDGQDDGNGMEIVIS